MEGQISAINGAFGSHYPRLRTTKRCSTAPGHARDIAFAPAMAQTLSKIGFNWNAPVF